MPYTEEQYKQAGFARRQLRLQAADAKALDELAKSSGQTISATVAELVRKAWRKKTRRRA